MIPEFLITHHNAIVIGSNVLLLAGVLLLTWQNFALRRAFYDAKIEALAAQHRCVVEVLARQLQHISHVEFVRQVHEILAPLAVQHEKDKQDAQNAASDLANVIAGDQRNKEATSHAGST